MFEVDDKLYELKYTIRTIEAIENATGSSLVATIKKTEGLLSITTLKAYFAFALFNEDGARVGQKQGAELAERLLESEGYMKLNEAVVVAIDRDCPFLFQVN